MGKYLTVPQLQAMGTGLLPLASFGDADLSAAIAQAEGQIDTYMAFREDQDLGFAAGPREERHPWDAVERRSYPHCFPVPIRSITLYEIVVSQQFGVGTYVAAVVDPTMVVIVNDLGYIEPISLTVVAYGLTPVVAQLVLIQPFAHLIYQAGYKLAKSNAVLHSNDGVTYHSLLTGWDLAAQTPVISINGVVQASGYTVSPADGSVTFTTPPGPTATVSATLTHTIPSAVTQATRLATIAVLSDALAMQQGFAGLSAITSGAVQKQRAARDRAWQDLLAPYKRLTIAGGGG